MTEAKLKELQELNGCKNVLAKLMQHLDEEHTEITIVAGCYDVEYAEMHVKMHPQFYEDFATFICQQWRKYKEAFDNA